VSKFQFYQNSYFDGLRQIQDGLADEAVQALVKNPAMVETINSWEEIPENLPEEFPQPLRDFFQFYQNQRLKVPEKVLKNGQKLVQEKIHLYVAMLSFYSLPYCYAFAHGAQVLIRSKRIIDDIGQRLGETGIFVMDIFAPGAFISNQKAFLTCARVRLIHAFSRYFIHNYAKDWDDAFGKPINQEDMIGTNLAFSWIVFRGWRKIGYTPSDSETKDFLNYWKWVGSLMGIQTEAWPETSKEAFELEKLLRGRHVRPSEAGFKLTEALMSYFKKTIPEPLLKKQLESIVYFLMGKEVSNAVGVKKGSPIQGDLLGVVFKLLGWQNNVKRGGYSNFVRTLEKSFLEEFGKKPQIQLPSLQRS